MLHARARVCVCADADSSVSESGVFGMVIKDTDPSDLRSLPGALWATANHLLVHAHDTHKHDYCLTLVMIEKLVVNVLV